MQKHTLKHYLPSLLSFGIAALFISIPALAVFLLAGGFILFGSAYAFLVYQMSKGTRRSGGMFSQSYQYHHESDNNRPEPTFKNITIRMIRRQGFFERDDR